MYELFKLGVRQAPLSCTKVVKTSVFFYTSGILLSEPLTLNIEYLKESKMREGMCNPVRYWDVKTGKCTYIETLAAHSNTDV